MLCYIVLYVQNEQVTGKYRAILKVLGKSGMPYICKDKKFNHPADFEAVTCYYRVILQ
ncbi:hypothetical protein Niako_4163 [Niastella koreensis GR20-10]|uniref:Uncharacterized protein n=1 Tax=Niastella koreensis (strain DSM 17620 / KACC 11465 / NBRC 106392 / GR20-10) TaxID=700598 RepID=G8TDI7_NIAKG|nr:hypothetical protein Niako_4163 [Niastella koreensis GR20-10]